MILVFSQKERKLLRRAGIKVDDKRDYTVDELYELSDMVDEASLEQELKDGAHAGDYFELCEKIAGWAEEQS